MCARCIVNPDLREYYSDELDHGCAHNFFFSLKGATLIGPSAIFLEHWGMPQLKSTSLNPSCKIETNVLSKVPRFQFIYMGVELWANHMG